MFESPFERTLVGLNPPEEPKKSERPPKPDQETESAKQYAEVVAFLNPRMAEEDSAWIPLMAAAAEHAEQLSEWDALAEEMKEAGGPVLTGEDLSSLLDGSELLKEAAELFQKDKLNEGIDRAA
jgi:hypothetical protein